MDVKIDYISFTVMADCRGTGEGGGDPFAAERALSLLHPVWWQQYAMLLAFDKGGARAHYGTSRYDQQTFTSVRFGGSANHILVEMPGTACQFARDHGLLGHIIHEARERLTRLDVAVDIVGGCAPSEFVASGYGTRWKSHASIISPDGETEYVGSMKSDRFSRIYMFNRPHPRAGTLRIETQLRADYAKSAAAVLLNEGLLVLASQLGNSFGWQHPSWQVSDLSDGKLRATKIDRNEPARVRWLYDVVVPSLVRADQEGLINLEEFWRTVAAFKAATAAGTTERGARLTIALASSLKKRRA